ncbi:MAG: hypothetical protein HeimC3_13700 [Candidatus Heimdallarchaeota archaeon LC_3]|nr:MAG: hypothetical protein HeimC3_13700 [Candidatus Heimdallarchaeota archaeon LC_3]
MKHISINNPSQEFSNIPNYPISPFTETYDTFIKTKHVVLRERTYHGSRRPYESVLLQYFVCSYFPKSFNVLPKLVKSNISYGRYSRFIADLDQIVSFFLVEISIPIRKAKELDAGYKKILHIAEETVNLAKSLNLSLYVLEWPTIEKILFKEKLSLADFPVTTEELTDQTNGVMFSTVTNDLDIFTFNGKMRIINRPDTTIPDLPNSIVIGQSLKDERPIGLSSNQCLIFGNNSTKVNQIVLNYLYELLPKGEDKKNLTIVFNFNDYQFDLPLDVPFIVKRFFPKDFSLDPFLLMQEYPALRINLIRSLIHIFEMLPSEVGTFQGLLYDYLQTKDHDESSPASIGDFIIFITSSASGMPAINTIGEQLTDTNNSFDIAKEQVNLDTLETQSPVFNRIYQTIESKIKYLTNMTNRRNTSAIPIILRKKGVLFVQANKTHQQEALLTFMLLTELAKIIDNSFNLITIGFDSVLSTVTNFAQQSYYRQYVKLAQRETFIFHFREFNPHYLSFIQLLGSEINTIWTDQIKNIDLPKNYHYTLQDNSDIAVLRRADNSSLYIPFSISKELRKASQTNKEQLPSTSYDKLRQLEPLSTVLAYRMFHHIANQPFFLNHPKLLSLQISEFYFDGLQAFTELEEKRYIQKNYRIIKCFEPAPEAKYLLDSIPTFFGQYKTVEIISLLSMNILDIDIDVILPGIISKDLPEYNWQLLYFFFHYINESIPADEIKDTLLQKAKELKKLESTNIETRAIRDDEQHNPQNITHEESFIPPSIEKTVDGNQQIAPGLTNRAKGSIEKLPSDTLGDSEIIRPRKNISESQQEISNINISEIDNTNDLVPDNTTSIPVTTREKIRFKKTKNIPLISRKIVDFHQFEGKYKEKLSSVADLNSLSLGKNKKGFTSIILLGKDTQNNQSSGIYSLIDNFYTEN